MVATWEASKIIPRVFCSLSFFFVFLNLFLRFIACRVQTNGGKVSDALGVNKSSSWAEALFFHTWGYRGKLQLPKSSSRGETDERLFFKRVTPLPSSAILFRLFIPVAPRDILSLRLTLCFPFPLRLFFCPRVACVVSLEQTHVYISRSPHRGTKREKTQ